MLVIDPAAPAGSVFRIRRIDFFDDLTKHVKLALALVITEDDRRIGTISVNGYS